MAKNYGEKGWIKLWRAEMNNPLYREEPFTKWQAWIDLCMRADSEGTVQTSLEALKNQWFWGSTHKVRDFLDTVQGTGMGTVIKTPKKGTLIRLNTDFLATGKKQKKGKKGTVSGTVSGIEEVLPKEVVGVTSSEISHPTNNNIKKINELEDELGDEYES